MQDPVA